MMQRRRLIPLLVLVCALFGLYAFWHTSDSGNCVPTHEQAVIDGINEDSPRTSMPEFRFYAFARFSGETRVITPSFQSAGQGRHPKVSSSMAPHLVLAGRRTDFSKSRSGLRSKYRYLHSICQLLI